MDKKENNKKILINNTWTFNSSVSKNFDLHVKQSVPFYSFFQQQIAIVSQWFLKENALVYDLGCSTGNTIQEICKLDLSSNFKIVGIDSKIKMIELAKKKILKNKKKNISIDFLNDDILNFKFKKSNLIYSILLFPFLDFRNRMLIYKRIYNSLEIGGGFIIVEKIRSRDSLFEDIYNQLYYDFKLSNKLTEKHLIAKAKSLRSAMTIFSLDENLKFLKKVGFHKFDILFKFHNFAGIILVK